MRRLRTRARARARGAESRRWGAGRSSEAASSGTRGAGLPSCSSLAMSAYIPITTYRALGTRLYRLPGTVLPDVDRTQPVYLGPPAGRSGEDRGHGGVCESGGADTEGPDECGAVRTARHGQDDV